MKKQKHRNGNTETMLILFDVVAFHKTEIESMVSSLEKRLYIICLILGKRLTTECDVFSSFVQFLLQYFLDIFYP